jgi:hypothetical protein
LSLGCLSGKPLCGGKRLVGEVALHYKLLV